MNSDFADSFVQFASGVKDPNSQSTFREPQPLADSVVFGLKNVRSSRLKILISALISSHSYNTLITKARRSVFFVDEAWLFMETPSIVSSFENLARRGKNT